MKNIFVCLVLFFSYQFAESAYAEGWVPRFKVTRLVAHDTGHLMVFVDPPLPTGFNGCANNAFLQVSSANPSFKNIYAALLLAATSQVSIGGYVTSCSAPMYEGPLLTRVDFLAAASTPYP